MAASNDPTDKDVHEDLEDKPNPPFVGTPTGKNDPTHNDPRGNDPTGRSDDADEDRSKPGT